jgi:hypothetical protein
LHILVGSQHILLGSEYVVVGSEHILVECEYFLGGSEHIIVDSEHIFVGSEHIIVVTEYIFVVMLNGSKTQFIVLRTYAYLRKLSPKVAHNGETYYCILAYAVSIFL